MASTTGQGWRPGQFAVKSGPVFASSNDFKITIRGKGAHAAMPHNGIDPRAGGLSVGTGLSDHHYAQQAPIEAAVISVTMLHAGEPTNVVADSCELQGTVRTFTLDVLDMIERRMQRIATSICDAFETTCEFTFRRNYPPTINHAAETEFVRKALGDLVGADNVLEFEPTMGAEDFSFLSARKARVLFPYRQRRWHASCRRPWRRALHAAQLQLRLQR